MKTLVTFFKSSSFVASLFISQTLSATPIISSFGLGSTAVSISVEKENRTVILQLNDIRSEGVNVEIMDDKGNVLVKDQIAATTASFAKKYNLDALDNGEYQISISKSNMETIQTLTLSEDGITADESGLVQKFSPSYVQHDGKLDINLMLAKSGKVAFTIYNEKGEAVFNDATNEKVTFARRYDLSQLAKGKYFITIETRSDLFNKAIVVE